MAHVLCQPLGQADCNHHRSPCIMANCRRKQVLEERCQPGARTALALLVVLSALAWWLDQGRVPAAIEPHERAAAAMLTEYQLHQQQNQARPQLGSDAVYSACIAQAANWQGEMHVMGLRACTVVQPDRPEALYSLAQVCWSFPKPPITVHFPGCRQEIFR